MARHGRTASRVLALLVLTPFLAFADDPPATPGESPGAPTATVGDLAADDGAEVVRFRGRPLFEVRAQLGPLTPSARVAAIDERIGRAVAAGPSVLDQIRVDEGPRSSDLVAGEQHIISVTDADALPTGRTRQQLAADYALTLRLALTEEFRARSARGLLVGAGVAIAATIVGALFMLVLNRLAPRLRAWLLSLPERFPGLARLPGHNVLPATTVAEVLAQVSRMVQLVLVLVASLVYVEVVLRAFPWTRELADRLLEAIRDAFVVVAGGLVDYLPNVFYIAVILMVTHYLLRLARLFFLAVDRGTLDIVGFYPEWAMPSFKILRFLVYAFAAVVIFPYLPGSGSPAFQGVSIFLGVLFSLGSTSAIANMVAGVVLTYMRPFRPGDRVRIADTVGDIIEKDLLVVRVRTIKNVEVTIPNSMVLNNHIINFSAAAERKGLVLHSTVTIGYDAPWPKVHELLVEAARRTEGVLAEPAPFVLQTALNDFYVSYEINAYTDRPNDMAGIYSALHQNIQECFHAAGVEIMSPHYVAARDGNRAAIPDDHLPKSYRPAAFRILPLGPGAAMEEPAPRTP